jgi:hypothetical protein
MVPAAFLASRALPAAATRRVAASSVAPVASGYERSVRPCPARVSQVQGTTYSGGDR